MKRTAVGIALALTLGVMAMMTTEAGAQAPGPTSGEQLASGLLSPRGMKIGPDGNLYVAEAGTGGSTSIEVDGAEHLIGNTGRISMIDVETGERTTVADDLPSDFGTATMDSVGPADVAFIGDQLYYLQTHGGEAYGFPDNPTGVYRVNDDGSTELVADIGEFNFDNPVSDIGPGGGQADIEPGGNPYAMAVRGGSFYVTDGNQNQLMKVDTDGTITRIAEFTGHPVTTGIALSGSGPAYVANLGTFPFAPEDGTIYSVGIPSGSTTEFASGISSMTDVEFGPGGVLYALNFGDQAAAAGGPPWDPFTGKLIRVSEDGTMVPVVSGFTFTTSVVFAGDTAYIANHGLSIPDVFEGEIWKVEGVSLLSGIDTPAPEPTTAPVASPTAPVGPITPPNTGYGDSAGDGTPWMALAGLLALAGLTVGGTAVTILRRG